MVSCDLPQGQDADHGLGDHTEVVQPLHTAHNLVVLPFKFPVRDAVLALLKLKVVSWWFCHCVSLSGCGVTRKGT